MNETETAAMTDLRARPARPGLPRAVLLAAASFSFLLSVFLWFFVDREQGLFVGLWVPSILSLGALLFNGRGGGA